MSKRDLRTPKTDLYATKETYPYQKRLMEETFIRDMVYYWHARCDKFVKKDIRAPKTDLHTTKETYQYEKRLIEETCRRDMVYFWHMRCDKCVKRDICK